MIDRLLEVKNLKIAFPTTSGVRYATHDVTINVGANERLGVVGESGSGKSVTALAILGLVQSPGRIVSGSVRWRGKDMLDPKVAQEVRGREIAMIFQDPMASLNPLMKIEKQISEVLVKRRGFDRSTANKRVIELLEMVGIPSPRERARQFPFEFSGGMLQRVMIASALASEPKLLIADEPTTALDVTIQAQILELLMNLSKDLGVSVMMITHDLGVVAEFCDRVQVMYAGRIVERAPCIPLFAEPLHPYSRGLIESSPRVDREVNSVEPIAGDPPSHALEISGCPFSNRCKESVARCSIEEPDLVEVSSMRWVSCWNREIKQ